MKKHKYWSIAAMVCMCMSVFSGFDKSTEESHKYWAMSAFGCMTMAMYSGYKLIHKPKKEKAEADEQKKDSM